MTLPLPILEIESSLIARLRETRRVVVSAPTGSGKSTQVPRMLLRSGLLGNGQAVVLQPRRIAARMLAARVAEEEGCTLGREVGYQVRLENASGPATRIRYVTEGILLRQMVGDARLAGVTAIVFDEFHERHLEGDVALARALDLQESGRPDLLIVVMSATLDGEKLESYLKPCAHVSTEGQMFPVRIEYAPPATADAPVHEAAADAVATWIRGGYDGDALVFMPGAWDIARTLELLKSRPETRDAALLPLHGELPPREQDAAVARADRRKIVVATNVAETSLTIDGVRLVVDSGLARLPRHDPRRGLNTLFIEPISRASADQRAGRAGRTAPGTCVRLWSEAEHKKRPAREEPEVKRLELAEAALALKAGGVKELRKFRWLDAPEEKALVHAENLLEDLGALDGEQEITALGRRLLAFPVHPRWARMLLAAGDLKCVRLACLVAAIMQGRDLLVRSADSMAVEFRKDVIGDRDTSDLWILVRAWEFAADNAFRFEACHRAGIHAQAARQVGPALEQFLRIAKKEGLDAEDRDVPEESLRRCVLAGFPDRVARRFDAATLRCEVVHGRRGLLARESAVRRATLFVAGEIREVEGRGREDKTLLGLATAIEPEWLEELLPFDLTRKVIVGFDAEAKRVTAEEVTRFRDLAIGKRAAEPPADEAAKRFADEVLAGRLQFREWDAAVDQWLLRVGFLAKTCPELGLNAPDETSRRAAVERLCAGSTTWKELRDRPVMREFRALVEPALQSQVERHAPERLELSNGKKPKLVYAADAPPHIALRIQELFGVARIPAIAMGRVVPALQILAPNNRPVQVTQDLARFWSEHYPKVKKEMQRKYPKHEWR
ncbi:MAG: ATP-dependent helicase [Planctomycetota bacterium]|nr:MAG: ATP-dependent helicase [Planctomycetota bacterium]